MSEPVGTAGGSSPAAQLAIGTSLVLAGQVAFVACGYVLHFYTSRALDALAFGTYGVIIGVLNWIQNALNNGIPWAARRYLAADPEAAPQILQNGLRWQMIIGALLFAASFLLAPGFASLTADDALAPYLRLAVIDLLTMALYTFYRGALNGFRLFAAQGASLAVYAAAKLLFTVLLVHRGYGLAGALVGNIMGTLSGWLLSWWLLRRLVRRTSVAHRQGTSRYGGRTLLTFALPTVLFTLASSFLTTVGLVAVKAVVQDGQLLAYYSAAHQLALAPTLLLVTFSWTLFPLLARSIAEGDAALARTYLGTALRLLALVLVPGIALILGTSPRLLSLVYPAQFEAAAPLLNLLFLGTGLYSVYMVFANAVLAEGRTALAVGVPCMLVPISSGATWYLTRAVGPVGAALAAAATTGVAAVALGTYVWRRFALQPDWRSLLRIAAASLALFVLTRVYSPQGVLLVVFYVVLAAAYVLLLLVGGEISWRDVRHWRCQLRHLLRPRNATGRT